MAEKSNDIESIYNAALTKESEAERSAYLDAICGDDDSLRARVEALIKAHEQAGDFLEVPVVDPKVILDGPAQIESPGTKIGRYELLELIGEGGMGLVYLAQQKEPVKRKVALKIVKLGMDTKQVVARFEAERQTLVLLGHPNIAHVFDASTTKTGRPYFVMEYVEGQSITKYCDGQKLSVEQRLELFQQVCEGIHHAHQKGIIHRDIKPSNILVSLQDNKPVPKIIDFGIAKAITQPLTEKTSYTERGQLLGTPEYMSPEQAEMAYQEVDTRSDIYSLGVVLYELLTGVTPFDAKRLREGGIDHIQQVICQEEPRTPSARLTSLGDKAKAVAERRRTQIITLTRRLHRELEWIPMKAMRKDRTRRYRSASELADDIQNYLTGTPLIAGPESTVYRTRKFVRKHAGSVAMVALVAVVIIIGLVASIVMGCRAEQARQKEATAREQVEQALIRAESAEKAAKEQRKVAEENAAKYRNLSYIHGIALADVKYRERNLRGARKLLESCPEDLRNWEWYRLNYVLDESIISFGPDGGALAIAFSPDGKRIASGNLNGTISIWDVESGREVTTFDGYNGPVYSIAFDLDGEQIVSGDGDGLVKVWDTSSGEKVMTLEGHETRISSVDLSADGKRIVSGDYRGVVKVWDASSGKELLTIQVDGKYVRSVAFSPDGKRILAGEYDFEIHEWDATTGKKLRAFRTANQQILQVSYSSDGRQIALGCGGGMIKIVDILTGEETILTSGEGWHQSLISSLAFSPDGKQLVSGGNDRMVRIWDTKTGKEVNTLVGHMAYINEVAFSPDGQRIVSVGVPVEIKIWNPNVNKKSTVLRDAKGNAAFQLAFSPDGGRLISGSTDNTVKVWDIKTATELTALRGHEDRVRAVSFSPDGMKIASGSRDRTIRLWDIATDAESITLRGHSDEVLSVVFAPDGKRIASGSTDKTIKVWDAASGGELMTLLGHDSEINTVAFSPDGNLIVSGDTYGVIKMWDASTGEDLKILFEQGTPVISIVFTPDGKRIVSGCYDGTVRIWDATTGNELMTLFGHAKQVYGVAISPDGKRIASGSPITAKVWDAATGAELMTLPVHETLMRVAFSPDSRTIATSHIGGYITLWESGPRPTVGDPGKSGESDHKIVD